MEIILLVIRIFELVDLTTVTSVWNHDAVSHRNKGCPNGNDGVKRAQTKNMMVLRPNTFREPMSRTLVSTMVDGMHHIYRSLTGAAQGQIPSGCPFRRPIQRIMSDTLGSMERGVRIAAHVGR